MKHSQEEIVNALKVIRETCSEVKIGDCVHCPFYYPKEGECYFLDIAPEGWKLNDSTEIWRAFDG